MAVSLCMTFLERHQNFLGLKEIYRVISYDRFYYILCLLWLWCINFVFTWSFYLFVLLNMYAPWHRISAPIDRWTDSSKILLLMYAYVKDAISIVHLLRRLMWLERALRKHVCKDTYEARLGLVFVSWGTFFLNRTLVFIRYIDSG